MRPCPACFTSYPDDVELCPVDGAALLPGGPLAGTLLGDRYLVEGVLGEGGMGTVCLVQHIHLKKRFALKLLRAELCADRQLVDRFHREAIAASKLNHPNIVQVSDFGRTDNAAFYLVMEYIEGESLASRLRREGTPPLEQSLRILKSVCSALGAAHAAGVVHRDIKPDNILLHRRPEWRDLVKVADFGISKVTTDVNTRLTRAGLVMGTPAYMAPEQAAGEAVDGRADIYSVGVMAYELLTGVLPFEGPTPIAILLKHRSEPPPPLRDRAMVPPHIESAVLQALSKRAEERPPTMEALAQALGLGFATPLEGRDTPLPSYGAPDKATPAPRSSPHSGNDAGGIAPTFVRKRALGTDPQGAALASTFVRGQEQPAASASLPSWDPGRSTRRRLWTVAGVVMALAAAGAVVWTRDPPPAVREAARAGAMASAAPAPSREPPATPSALATRPPAAPPATSRSAAAASATARPPASAPAASRPTVPARATLATRKHSALPLPATSVASPPAAAPSTRPPQPAPLSSPASSLAAPPSPAPLPLELRSHPSGASVFVAGRLLGHTPLRVQGPDVRVVTYQFAFPGFETLGRQPRGEEKVMEVILKRPSPPPPPPPASLPERDPRETVDDLKPLP